MCPGPVPAFFAGTEPALSLPKGRGFKSPIQLS